MTCLYLDLAWRFLYWAPTITMCETQYFLTSNFQGGGDLGIPLCVVQGTMKHCGLMFKMKLFLVSLGFGVKCTSSNLYG